MDHICLVLPLLPGRGEASAAFLQELDAARVNQYRASQERIGISKEVWFLAALPSGSALVAYIEAASFATAVERFSRSADAFDMWFKSNLAECTGVDLNNPPPLTLPKALSSYSARAA